MLASLNSISQSELDGVSRTLWQMYRNDGTLFICGNGGSAATATHLACDLSKATRIGGMPPFRSIALTNNVPLITAWANDESYNYIFTQQLASLARPEKDVLLCISASGRSTNILAALNWAKDHDMITIAFTGQNGIKFAHHSLIAPHSLAPVIEDVHSVICHSITESMKQMIMELRWKEIGILPQEET